MMKIPGWVAAILLVLGVTRTGAVVLSSGHIDVIGINYEAGAWDLHVHDEDTDTEYEPDEVVTHISDAGKVTVPVNPLFAFLGSPGSVVWIGPQVQNPPLPFLGISAEELDGTVFDAPDVTLMLTGFSGPPGGKFFLYQTDGFGVPTVFMNTDDGLSSADNVIVPEGSHAHYNWAFTTNGTYFLTFTASGTLAGGGGVTSETATWEFLIGDLTAVPEPGTVMLLALGGGLLWARRRKGH